VMATSCSFFTCQSPGFVLHQHMPTPSMSHSRDNLDLVFEIVV
jgi:hypothetical protein